MLQKAFPNKPEPLDMCKCDNCGWEGEVLGLEFYEEQESWEMPWITWKTHICPKCSKDIDPDGYFPSEEWIKRNVESE